MVIALTEKQDSTISVLPLGSSLNRKQRLLWERIEKDILAGHPNYVPSLTIKRKQEEKEFFILRHGEKTIGRAAATIDQRWLTKGENVSFIDDFVITPEDKEYAYILVERCLATLKEKGARQVMVRSRGFPGLAERNKELPPYGLPYNPPWYIGLFMENGFTKYKEWQSYRWDIPHISPQELKKTEEFLDNLGLKAKTLNLLSRREVEGYSKLVMATLGDHFGYNPEAIGGSSLFKRVLNWLMFRLARVRIYVLQNKAGEIVAYYSWHPDYNMVLTRKGKGLSLVDPRLFLSLGRVKRAVTGSQGHAEVLRGKGLWRAMLPFRLNKMAQQGYTELDSGRVLVDNIPAMKSAASTSSRYGVERRFATYYTLAYKFKA